MLHRSSKILKNYGIGSIVLVSTYLIISVVMLLSGINEAKSNNREYEINFIRKMEVVGIVNFFIQDNFELKEYSSFIKIYYTEEDINEMIAESSVGIGLEPSEVVIPEYYYPNMNEWSRIFSLVFVLWMFYSVITDIHIISNRMFRHTIIIQVPLILMWVVSEGLVLLSLRGFLMFFPLMLLNIYVIRNTRFKDIKEHWFKGIFKYEEPARLY